MNQLRRFIALCQGKTMPREEKKYQKMSIGTYYPDILVKKSEVQDTLDAEFPAPYIRSTYCCCLKEVHEIQRCYEYEDGTVYRWSPADVIGSLSGYMFANGYFPGGQYFFCQAQGEDIHKAVWNAGDELKKFIEDNNLGTVSVTPEAFNPNSLNTVKTFVWNVNEATVHLWCQRQPRYFKDENNRKNYKGK